MAAAATKQKTRVRRDPVRRPNDGVSPLARLTNTDPNRKYVWVNTNDTLFGVDYYFSLGYDIERKTDDGVRQTGTGRNPFHRAKPGEESYIMYMGSVLMSCPRDVAEEIEQFGPDAASGQARWDEIEAHISKQGMKDRLVRDIPGIIGREGAPVVQVVENSTRPLEPDLGI